MAEQTKIFQWRRETGTPLNIAGEQGKHVEVTPQAQALIVRWPNGGLVWSRPVAALVKNHAQPDASPTRVPILDVTRIAQLTLLSLSVIFIAISIIGFTEKTTKALRHKERSKKILKI